MLINYKKPILYSIPCIFIWCICHFIINIDSIYSTRSNAEIILEQVIEVAEVSNMSSKDINVTSTNTNSIKLLSDNKEVLNVFYINKDNIGMNYIRLNVPTVSNSIIIEDNYRSKSISIKVQLKEDNEYKINDILELVNGGQLEDFDANWSANDVKAIYYNNKNSNIQTVFSDSLNQVYSNENSWNENDGVFKAVKILRGVDEYTINYEIIIQLNKVYAQQIYYDRDELYIALKPPYSVYDKIVVIDAGHGGKDSGAVGINDYYLEKNLNLMVVEKMKRLLDRENIKVYYTRLDDQTTYLLPRVSFVNEVEADLFLSIHFNASEYESASGSEVLYNDKDCNEYLSYKFANNCLDEIYKVTKNLNRGLVKGSEMMIVGNSTVPVALVEIGFITNKEELSLITKNTTHDAISVGLVNAIKKTLQEIKN